MKTKIIVITAGRGPTECSLVVAQVLKMMLKEIRLNGLVYTILKHQAGTINGSIETASLEIKGKGLDKFLSTWLGTIQWIAKSPIRPKHKRKNWFIGIFAFEQDQEVKFDANKVIFQTMRSSGAGGQHVNIVSSAVRAIDPDTKIQVVVQESRSQHQNKKIALRKLEEKLQDNTFLNTEKLINQQWLSSLEIERGNPIRILRGGDFKKIKRAETNKSIRLKERNKLKNEFGNEYKF